jgi:hypothetical protein
MNRTFQGADHVWLVMMKAMRALTRYAAAGVEETGLGLSDFGVLEVLLHKGPLPVNTIGPIVDLTPGSISIAVDRLVAKGLVSRVESAEPGSPTGAGTGGVNRLTTAAHTSDLRRHRAPQLEQEQHPILVCD